MPDAKITALTAISVIDPAVDPLPIVDVSDTAMAASGTTKKITINQILGASGTATLASATISGNLTVDTNTLFVDAANNRVIVGHTSGASAFQVSNAGAAGFEVQPTGVNSAPAILSYNRSGAAWIQLTYGASSHVFQLSGTDGMTLNSTGLGVGVVPSAKLHVEGGGAQARFSIASASDARHEYYRNGIREGLITWDANVIGLYATQSSGEVVIASSNTIRVRVKTGGQVRFVPLASDPASAEAGDVYYNSSSNKLKCYNGTTWNDLF